MTSPLPTFRPNRDLWELLFIPDTQYLSATNYNIVTQWIADNWYAINGRMAVSCGDLVDVYNDTDQWDKASAAFGILDTASIPYTVLPGNHDSNNGSDLSYYDDYFGTGVNRGPSFASRYYWGGAYSTSNEGNYVLFTASGINYLLITLGYTWPYDAGVMSWAAGIINANPARKVVIVTHMFLAGGGVGSYAGVPIQAYATENGFWQTLVVPYSNVFLVLSGHFITGSTPAGYESVASTIVGDRTVHQVLANYQDLYAGNNGTCIRRLQFNPATQQIRIRTFCTKTAAFVVDLWCEGSSDFYLDVSGI